MLPKIRWFLPEESLNCIAKVAFIAINDVWNVVIVGTNDITTKNENWHLFASLSNSDTFCAVVLNLAFELVYSYYDLNIEWLRPACSQVESPQLLITL